jgi:hypothetical protein
MILTGVRANGCFVTEGGNEQYSRFENCGAISPVIGYNTKSSGVLELTDTTQQGGVIVDVAMEGAGFWFRAFGCDLIDCTTYGGLNGIAVSGYKTLNLNTGHPNGGLRSYRVAQRGSSQTFTAYSAPNPGVIVNCETWASWNGMYLLYPSQFPGPHDDTVTRVIDDLLVVNCHKFGVTAYHNGREHFNNLTILFDTDATNANSTQSSQGLGRWRHTVGWHGNPSYGSSGVVLNYLKVSGGVLGVMVPSKTNWNQELGEKFWVNGAELATQFGMLGTHPSNSFGIGRLEFEAVDVIFLPHGVDRAPSSWLGFYGGDMKFGIGIPYADEELAPQLFNDVVMNGIRIWPKYDLNAPTNTIDAPNIDYPEWFGLLED